MRGFRVERVENFKPFNELSFSTRKALSEITPDTYAGVYPRVGLSKVFGDLVIHFRIDEDYGYINLSLAYRNYQNTHAFWSLPLSNRLDQTPLMPTLTPPDLIGLDL